MMRKASWPAERDPANSSMKTKGSGKKVLASAGRPATAPNVVDCGADDEIARLERQLTNAAT
jgi:hypothetical protein